MADERTRDSDMLRVQFRYSASKKLGSRKRRRGNFTRLRENREHADYQDRNCKAQKTGLAQAAILVAAFAYKTVPGW